MLPKPKQGIAWIGHNYSLLMGIEAVCDPEQVISAAELVRAALCTIRLNMVEALLRTLKFCLNCFCQNMGCGLREGNFKTHEIGGNSSGALHEREVLLFEVYEPWH